MTVKKVNKVCTCKNCGNEAEMEFTCTMPEDLEDDLEEESPKEPKEKTRVKGTGTCLSCGNEADLWIDF